MRENKSANLGFVVVRRKEQRKERKYKKRRNEMKRNGTIGIAALVLLVSWMTMPVNAVGIGQPDLKVTAFTATIGGSPESNTRDVTISWTIASEGKKATGPFVVELKNGNAVIQTITYQSLDPKKGAGSVSGQKTLNLPPGTYEFTISVDTTKVVNETDESNNIATNRVIIPKTPVLKTITVSPSSATVEVGKTQAFIANTKDQYSEAYPATITWTINTISNNGIVGRIDSNGVFTADASGQAIITASNKSISGSASVTVTAPPAINIAIGNVYIPCSSAPSPLYPPGQTVYVRDPVCVAFDINNKGTQTIGSVPIVVRLNGNIIIKMNSGSIPPGGIIHIKEMSNYVFDIVGYNEITVEAVVPGDIDQSDNTGKVGVYVQELMLADLVVSDCQVSNGGAATGGADSISFGCYIGNIGTAPAYDLLFEAITSEGKIIHSERLNLNPNEWQLVARNTVEPFPTTGELGISFVVNSDQRIQEMTFGNNFDYVTVYPLLNPGPAIPQ